jgi:large subunit ribosomal protein L19
MRVIYVSASQYIPPSSIRVPESQFPNPSLEGKNMMQLLDEEEVKRTTDNRAELFAKRGKNRVIPGDVLLVESYTNKTNKGSSMFAGICIAIRRSGLDTSFTLRNVIMKVGVEQRFPVFSPLIKSIKILQKGKGYRRAKLFYLRDEPGKTVRISGSMRDEARKAGKK